MSLRDYLTANYFLPLFAGVRSSTTAPPGTYNPGSQIGSGLPGGIGAGDGGFDTPVDPSIDTPTFIYPSVAVGLDLPVCAIMATSAFSATGGQTHIASRWMIELMDGATSVGYVYDSGADINLLTNLPIAPLGLQNGATFRVTVRYKGSNGGWGDWGSQVFTRAICDDDACSLVQPFSETFDSAALTTHPYTLALPEVVKHWQNVKVYLHAVSTWDDSGTITGNVTTFTPTHTPPAIVTYSGADVLIANGTTDPITGTITNSIAGGCSYSIQLKFTSTTVSGCPGTALPPAPPPGPVFPPPPPPPPPPPAPAPDTPAGHAQLNIDWANSYVWVSVDCGYVYKFTELDAIGGAVATGGPINIGITVQNLSPTTAGSTYVTITADNTRLVFYDGQTRNLSVGPGGHATVTWRVYIGPEAVNQGTYTLTITSPQGNRTQQLVVVPPTGCMTSPGDSGA